MIRQWAAAFVLGITSLGWPQEIIRGAYSYTYGDNENLVQARQTCKNLAVRDAIESYYLFVESTTTVENAQTKHDIVNSIAAGAVQNLKIVEQKEEGRIISMTVEGSVDSAQVRQLVYKAAGTYLTAVDTSSAKPISAASTENEEVRFNVALSKYENRMVSVQNQWNTKQYDGAINQVRDIQKWLAANQPKSQNRFDQLLFQSMQTRNDVLIDLMQMEKAEALHRKVRERAAGHMLLAKTGRMEGEMRDLEKLTGLSQRQTMLRKWWSDLCKVTATRVRNAVRQNRVN